MTLSDRLYVAPSARLADDAKIRLWVNGNNMEGGEEDNKGKNTTEYTFGLLSKSILAMTSPRYYHKDG
jgi:hypothetical protein